MAIKDGVHEGCGGKLKTVTPMGHGQPYVHCTKCNTAAISYMDTIAPCFHCGQKEFTQEGLDNDWVVCPYCGVLLDDVMDKIEGVQ